MRTFIKKHNRYIINILIHLRSYVKESIQIYKRQDMNTKRYMNYIIHSLWIILKYLLVNIKQRS
jgi:hypothetical protein